MSEDCDDDYFDDEDEDVDDYYSHNNYLATSDEDDLAETSDIGIHANSNVIKKRIQELENFEYECLTVVEASEKLRKEMETAAIYLSLSPSLSCLVLHANKWKMAAVVARSSVPSEKSKMLFESGVILNPSDSDKKTSEGKKKHLKSKSVCQVCFEYFGPSSLASLSCNHLFCRSCWKSHVEVAILDGLSSGIPCMDSSCSLLCPEDFVRPFLTNKRCRGSETIAGLYDKHLFQKLVGAHYQLRFCPGVDCNAVFFADSPKPRLVRCTKCKTTCCFECGNPYHIPTDCETIKQWLLKCADDSETANYINAHTKDCPNCHACIEKSGGCNHMKCLKCKHDFCWVCLGEWKKHGDSYYECSRYKENPKLADENQHTKAREALKKYLFYFERWENHSQSLRLESEARSKIQKLIEEKVNNNDGTWIDWQYLLKAGELLAQCRSILHFTYPWAYYADVGPKKALFEYQQAQLELEIEDLAWKLEHVGDYHRGDIENQMDICEKRTHTLIARFVQD